MLKQDKAARVLDPKADSLVLKGDDLRAGAQKMQAAKRDHRSDLLATADDLAKSPIPEVCRYALAVKAALEGKPAENFAKLKNEAKAAVSASRPA